MGATENAQESEPVSEAASEAVVDAEAAVLESEPEPEEKKPPRKPRIKLGDIMGVINRINFALFFLLIKSLSALFGSDVCGR